MTCFLLFCVGVNGAAVFGRIVDNESAPFLCPPVVDGRRAWTSGLALLSGLSGDGFNSGQALPNTRLASLGAMIGRVDAQDAQIIQGSCSHRVCNALSLGRHLSLYEAFTSS